jgi:hypothetical protein
MTRSRLTATAALSMSVLLIATSGGEAQKSPTKPGPGEDRYRLSASCKTRHPYTGAPKAKIKSVLERLAGGGRASAVVPVKNAKVVTKMQDLSPQNGEDVLDAKDTDETNADGVARTSHRFDDFGNYEVTVKAKVDGEVVADDTIRFGVLNQEGGACDPPIGAQ